MREQKDFAACRRMQLIRLRHETGAKFAFKLVINANENESHEKNKIKTENRNVHKPSEGERGRKECGNNLLRKTETINYTKDNKRAGHEGCK